MTVRAAIIEMHVVQCSDRFDAAITAAVELPWWAWARRRALLRRARVAEHELRYWWERAELEQREHGGEACTS